MNVTERELDAFIQVARKLQMAGPMPGRDVRAITKTRPWRNLFQKALAARNE